jgi:hypothetical protein
MKNLKEQLQEVKKWHRSSQVLFCEKIVQNIYLATRSVWPDDSLTCDVKLEAIKWINEFIHRIDNFKFRLNKAPMSENIDIFEIGRHAKFYADLNEIAMGEIGAIITSAYEMVANSNYYIKPENSGNNLFELLRSDSFRKRPAMYLGEATLSNLQNFIAGYYFPQDMHKFSLIPQEQQFQDFHDWVARYCGWKESTAGWKNIILQECQGDEKKALDSFFELYDNFYRSV